jgi:hypothetical protein
MHCSSKYGRNQENIYPHTQQAKLVDAKGNRTSSTRRGWGGGGGGTHGSVGGGGGERELLVRVVVLVEEICRFHGEEASISNQEPSKQRQKVPNQKGR